MPILKRYDGSRLNGGSGCSHKETGVHPEANYVLRFEAALLNAELMALAKVPKVAIAAKESRTSRSAYSVKS
jgi:hypothetical protein